MTVSFRPAKRENVSLLIGLAGGTGAGKTMSAFELAKGLSGGAKFAVIDTEAGRALHYADLYDFDHGDLKPPFRPEAYADAIKAADEAGYPVIVVDSASHEHAGEGGLLDWHEEELDRMAGTDWKRREALTFAAWVKPKQAHKQMVNRLLQVRAHLILCFRAQQSIEIVKDANGKTVVQPKRSLTGLDGWIPVSEKNLPYELTLSFLVTADAPGVPKPIKLPAQLRQFFPLDQPVSAATGATLAAWATGSSSGPEPKTSSAVSAAPAGEQPSGPDQLSGTEFATRCTEAGITPATVRTKAEELFPGRTGLTAQERARLWNALSTATPPEAAADAATETSPTGGGGGQQVEGPTTETAAARTPSPAAETANAGPSTPDDPGATLIQNGQHKGHTYAHVAALPDGDTWLFWALRQRQYQDTPLEAFVQAAKPDIWARFVEWKAKQTVAA